MDHYEVLGVAHTADRETIMTFYRRRMSYLAARLRRSRTESDRAEVEHLVREMETACHVLTDPYRRMAYDMSLSPALTPAVAQEAETATPAAAGPVPAGPVPAGPIRQEAPEAPGGPPVPVVPTVRSVQWMTEAPAPEVEDETGTPLPTTAPPAEHGRTGPMPTTAPPPEPQPGWDWRWVGAIAAVGLLAFGAGVAMVSGGLRPVVIGPQALPSPTILATAAPTAAPVAEAPPVAPAVEEPPAVPVGPVGTRYTQYVNEAHGYSLVYPEDLLLPQGESADGAAQTFTSADGQTLVQTNAVPNAGGVSLQTAFAQSRADAAGREVTYATAGTSWFVVSGYEGDRLFYEKVILDGEVYKTLRITFPRQFREAYYSLVEEMSHSFKAVD